jgi:hypothetical protein
VAKTVPAASPRPPIKDCDNNVGTNLINQHPRDQDIDFGYFGIDAYNRPIAFGFALTAKY